MDSLALKLRDPLVDALTRAYNAYIALGEGGKLLIESTNQFGDRPTLLDITAEKIVIDALRVLALEVGAIRVHSEEHGTIVIGDGPIKYTVYLDGCDGSSVYLKSSPDKPNAGFGTMVAVAEGDNPRYDNIVFSAILRMDIAQVMYRVVRGNTFIRSLLKADTQSFAATRTIYSIYDPCVVLSDNGFAAVRNTFDAPLNAAGIRTHWTGTTCGNGFNVIARKRVIIDFSNPDPAAQLDAAALVERVDKGALEMPALYHLMVGAEGDMYDLETRQSVAVQHINTYGQDPRNPAFFVLASNPNLAREIFALVG
jgi:hypothetical protein